MPHHLPPEDPSFPLALAQTGRARLGLWVDGTLPDGVGIAVVGTRRASEAGLSWARTIGALLAEHGAVVWSGGALGIDQAAHEGALDAGGRTVICAPSGLASPYPPGSERLWARAVERGAVVSMVPPDQKATTGQFLARNGVLAAMTMATVLVEAPFDSGARNTTSHARKLGRPVYVATQPFGSRFAAAVREEARLGATLIHEPSQLLSLLSLSGKDAANGAQPRDAATSLSADAKVLLGALTAAPRHADEVAACAKLTASALAIASTELVLTGLAVDEPGRGLRLK